MEENCTKYLTSTLQKQPDHKSQGKTGAAKDQRKRKRRETRCDIASWTGSGAGEGNQWETGELRMQLLA